MAAERRYNLQALNAAPHFRAEKPGEGDAFGLLERVKASRRSGEACR